MVAESRTAEDSSIDVSTGDEQKGMCTKKELLRFDDVFDLVSFEGEEDNHVKWFVKKESDSSSSSSSLSSSSSSTPLASTMSRPIKDESNSCVFTSPGAGGGSPQSKNVSGRSSGLWVYEMVDEPEARAYYCQFRLPASMVRMLSWRRAIVKGEVRAVFRLEFVPYGIHARG